MDRWIDGRMDQWKGRIKKQHERIREGQEDKLMMEAQTNRWRKKTTERGQCFDETVLGIYGP